MNDATVMLPQITLPQIVEYLLMAVAVAVAIIRAAGWELPAIPDDWQGWIGAIGLILGLLLRGGQHVARVQAARRAAA
jgi:hypothetical protein